MASICTWQIVQREKKMGHFYNLSLTTGENFPKMILHVISQCKLYHVTPPRNLTRPITPTLQLWVGHDSPETWAEWKIRRYVNRTRFSWNKEMKKKKRYWKDNQKNIATPIFQKVFSFQEEPKHTILMITYLFLSVCVGFVKYKCFLYFHNNFTDISLGKTNKYLINLEEPISYNISNNNSFVFNILKIVPGTWWFTKNADAISFHSYVFSFEKMLYFIIIYYFDAAALSKLLSLC